MTERDSFEEDSERYFSFDWVIYYFSGVFVADNS